MNKVSKLSKVTIALTVAAAALTGVVGTQPAAAAPAAQSQPCCKTGW